MNQNIIIADDFGDIAHKYHKGIVEEISFYRRNT